MSGVVLAPQLAPGARWSLMFGNFVIGCGVMVVPGTLNDMARSLQVSVALAGQLIAITAATMALGAPLMAGFDRRRLLALSLRAWREVFTSPLLMAIVLVTALSGAGQFTLFSYFAPCFKQTPGSSTEQLTFLPMWFGAFGLIGNVVLTRVIDRVGPNIAVAVTVALGLIAHFGFAPLNWVGLVWLAAALALSLWAGRRATKGLA
jgi:predicted MFS family arabinose efflux permease